MSDTTLSDALTGGAVAGGGLLIGLLLVVVILAILAVPISGILWYFGIVSIEIVVAVMVVSNTLAIFFAGQ